MFVFNIMSYCGVEDPEFELWMCPTGIATSAIFLNAGLWSPSRKEFWVELESVKMYQLRLQPWYKILNIC
jgi:hypothetical protein